ncbi:alpha-2-macroglobulin [Flavobacterium sp. LM4]|uniref:alpha-2-macroglobulin family protein n=1 Tax=Flavobacterium sp. LM4 TaxID=1938609 RepID=UPI000994842B|nr:MG2 domain-containing protein [Flavobacterium sp. LM4]OOV18294.1 hypothetical protein BXU10_00840 [Flavobacterium sp. LM4]
MKNILFVFLLLSTALFSQQTDKKWEKVTAFENQGRIKSANKIVVKIYKKAISDKDEAQMIKCFFYQSKYLQVVDENAKKTILSNLKTDIDRVSIPSKAILNLIYAKCLDNYYQYDDYSYAVDSASTVVEAALINLAAATIDTSEVDGISKTNNFNVGFSTQRSVISLFKKTLENETILKATPLTNYQPIFEYLTLEKLKSENLYDYLLKENITFFIQKIEKWEIEKNIFLHYKEQLIGDSSAFTKLNLDFLKDENVKKVLSLYQKQEVNHPTLENEFERVQFCNTYLLQSEEDFIKYLKEIENRSKDEILTQKIKLEIGNIILNKASKETYPKNNIEAVAIFDDIIKINSQSNTAKSALAQKQETISKTLLVELQKYTYKNENTRALVHYKNVNYLTISFFKITQKKTQELRKNHDLLDSIAPLIIKKQSEIASQKYEFENKGDYFEYSTEVILPKLETGNYLAYFETDSDSKEKAYDYQIITVSNIAVVANQTQSIENYQVLDRKTGKPIENAIIKSASFTLKTDSKGLAFFNKVSDRYNNETIEILTENDSIFIDKEFIRQSVDYKESENEKTNGKIEFYLDRAIYRPGQTVYYKGIAIQKTKNKTSIIANATFKVTVNDSNAQIIKEFEVTTNEFGSFSGEFTLPKNGLTGQFSLNAFKPQVKSPFLEDVNFANSEISFNVEEYKRPKFEVTFDPKKESFQINQSIKVKGNAKAFAGSNISDAKVTYTVTRYTSYYRNYFGNEEDEVITFGETKTDASGKFSIDFTALPSKNSKKEQLPVFNYKIYATITDVNGETHSAVSIIKVGFHDLIINASIPNEIKTKDKNEINLSSTNLNGEFLAAKGEIKLYFIEPLSNKFKSRIWEKPEIETITPEDFERLFPYEKSERQTKEKRSEILLFTKKIDTQKDKKIVLDFISNYKSGSYKIVFSAKDSFNNPIETISNFKLIQSKDKFDPSQLFTAQQINQNPKKDGYVEVKLSSVIPELYIAVNGNYYSKVYFEDTFHLQNNETIIRIPLKNDFEKSIKLGFESVFENENFMEEISIELKDEEPKLEWTVESFRNKIQPGTSENWSFKLNAFNTQTEAEVLASMYDSSLDQFSKKEWETLNFRQFNYNGTNFKERLGFDTVNASLQNLNTGIDDTVSRIEETKLNWFEFDFNDNGYMYGSYRRDIYDIKDRKIGSETIKGDPDAVLTVAEPFGAAPNAIVIEKDSVYMPGYKTKKALMYNSRSGKSSFKIKGSISNSTGKPLYIIDGEIASENEFNTLDTSEILSAETMIAEKATALYGTKGANGAIIITTKKALEALTKVKTRKNLSETAFFLPHLKTDSKGKVSFNFTSPEALTAWKLRLLAHNKDAVSGYLEKSVITQKELMVLPNFPRFFREKDTIVISAKISNITAEAKTGIAILQFFDAVTLQPIDAKMLNAKNVRNFNVGAFGNTTATWTISIPEGLQGVQYKILAKSGNFSDGEENILPVLTNNMLVTESIPIWVRENSTKEYTFANLKNNTSTTLRNHQFTLEYTSNPTWIAIQSLPYLMEYEHECAEQTFARFYSNTLASEIISSNPKIATVFEEWRKNGKLNSKLEENEELKSIILAETPWLNDAQSEDEKKKNLALLFDLEKMKTSQEAAFKKLKKKQNSSGGFPWFEGGNESEYITRHILAGLGHLSKLNKDEINASKMDEIAKNGIPYLDSKFLESYKIMTKNVKKADKFFWINPYSDLYYLYTRSFYLEKYPLSDTLKKATKLYLETAKKDWLKYSLYEKGLAALTLNRFGEAESAKKIIESLKETASNNEDWGMYWIANKPGWYWYQAPIETQALLIEAFAEVTNDTKSVDAMKVWLLKNKQTKNWPTTKSTTEAIYALLMQGTDWLSVKDNTVIKLGDEKIMTKKLAENEKEAATGYIKMNWKANEIKKEMASITIENKSKVPGFGGVYWQYFEDLDKIKTNSGSTLSVKKELYLKKNSLKGDKLERITSKNPLKTGDLVTVRLVINSKEDMEFVHLKDMRASCFEPVNVLSEYQYKDRLGYYMSTKDAATHFFFDQINKGTYVLEYEIRVNNSGEFSNGITTIESMYAPEFTSHTKGIRVKVE